MKQVLLIVMIAISIASFAQQNVSSSNRKDTVANANDTKFMIQLNDQQVGLLLGVLNTAKINGADKKVMQQFLYLIQTISIQVEEQSKNKAIKKPE